MYQGIYNGARKHESDLSNVLKRANECGVDKLIVTGVNLQSSRDALAIAEEYGIVVCIFGLPANECARTFSY